MGKSALGKSKPTGSGFLGNEMVQGAILIILGLLFYANTFANLYALDDGIVILNNTYVQEGFAGIPKIFATDVYQNFYSRMGSDQPLSGGRYRPLSVVTFAIEQQLFGSNSDPKPEGDVAFIRHFINVSLYLFSVLCLLHLLRRHVLPKTPLIAFLSCVLFLIHPVHTEVVANVKSRDEIMSFLFVVLTLIFVFRYRETAKISQLICGLLFYFLALLSKEYAVTLIALVPMLLFMVSKETLTNSFKAVLPYMGVLTIYLILRFSIVGWGSVSEDGDVLNNPFKFATMPEKWATKIEILNHYLRLLFWPSPLSSDYSYNTIPYTNFGDTRVWLSIVLHLGMIGATIVLFLRRNLLAFAFAFYLLNLFLVSNFAINIGATMGERLIYHSSFGFVLALALLCGWAIGKVGSGEKQAGAVVALALGLALPCAAVVIPRNAQWKNDATLFLTDVETVPNSALANGNAGKACIDMSERPEHKTDALELTRKSIPYSEKAVRIHKEHLNGYLNLGVAYCRLGEYDKAEEYWNIAQKIYPDHPSVKNNFHVLGLFYLERGKTAATVDLVEAQRWLENATRVDPENPDAWYQLGKVAFGGGDYSKARAAWGRALQLKPDYKEAEQGLASLP